LARFAPDLVHCETEFIIGRMGQRAAARAGVPIVTSFHTDFGKYTEAYGMGWLRGTVSAFLGRFHRRALRTYTPSGPAREQVLALGARDVEVWGRGVDVDTFHPSRRSHVQRHLLGLGERFTFVHVGRLAAEKGVERIVEAFRIASASLPADSIRLVIAGSGPREASLRASAPRDVMFLGYLDRTRDLPALYASSDAFVFASLTETLGLVVLEAMASGLPVIAAPVGGVADHLRDGVNGLAYPPGDAEAMAAALVRLVLDRALARALGSGARATAEALTWSRELDRLDASYREVLALAAHGAARQHLSITDAPGAEHGGRRRAPPPARGSRTA
jgi:glycosyltransferase involved in cell wall biosynthesis